jgi:molybdate/tungstate transport system substrate-binding protein
MNELKNAFEQKYPQYSVVIEAAGSRACCRKVTELNRNADIIFSADYKVFEDLLMPEYADWYIKYAINRLVIAYTEHSKYSDEINSKNWFNILVKKDVNFGHSDPNLDPAGYRTIMCWELADKYYKKNVLNMLNKACKPRNIRPSSVQLLSMLQNYSLDYAFEYESVCMQHHLKYVKLPDEIDLSNPKFAKEYEKAVVKVTGKKKGTFSYLKGSPIVYAFTILKNAKNKKGALKFAEFLLSKDGRNIFSENQPLLKHPIANNIKLVPEELRKYIGK